MQKSDKRVPKNKKINTKYHKQLLNKQIIKNLICFFNAFKSTFKFNTGINIHKLM